jgi:HEAT repeat protein
VALDDRSAAVRADAAQVLGRLGPAATQAVPALRQRSTDDDPAVRLKVERALKQIESGP